MAERAKVIPMNRGYEPSRVVHLRNLPEDIDMDDVMELGRPFGPVISALRIKETQAFLYMQELKDAEELVNEYRQHPPKIGWRTVFVQFSQYTRLDVGARKSDTQGRTRQSDARSGDRHVRDRSRERSSRRSSSPDSPPSPPLPDITVPFYMLPRAEEPELSIPPTSRPQLVSYPHLANAARLPLISYPAPQTHDGAPHPLISAQTQSAAPDTDTSLLSTQLEPHQQPHTAYEEQQSQRPAHYNSMVHNVANHQLQQQSTGAQSDPPESSLNCLQSVIECIAADVEASRHKATSDLLSCVSHVDAAVVETLRRDFGERSLPAIVSTVVALRQLDTDAVSIVASVNAASVNDISSLYSFAGVDDFTSLFLRIVQTLHAGSRLSAAKRRRYDDSYDSNNFASSSSVMYLQQNEMWNSATDYHQHQQH